MTRLGGFKRALARGFLAAVVGLAALTVPGVRSAQAASFVVSSLDDAGAGTLRQAILDANAASGDDTITFSVSGTITVAAPLPTITGGLSVDGSGQSVTISGGGSERLFWAPYSSSSFTLNFSYLTLADGYSSQGAAIANDGHTLNIDHVTFRDNFAHSGGAIFHSSAPMTITASLFDGNGTNDAGGLGDHGTGGAIHVLGNNPGPANVVIANTTFSGSTTNNAGAAIASNGGVVTLIHVTVADSVTLNTGNVNPNGAIFAYTNSATQITLVNTLVTGSSGGGCANNVIDGGGNLSFPDASCPGLNADPLLAPLADNGGPTLTRALGAGSPAIDAAGAAACAAAPVSSLDQRGVARPIGAGCDIGALEQEPGLVFTFDGFYPPVDNPGPGPQYVFNEAKAGSAVPVKFSLGGDYGLEVFASGYPAAQTVSCSTAGTIDPIEETVTAGGSGLSYNPDNGVYTYVWSTAKNWSGSCRKLTVRFVDGTEAFAFFRFR